MANTLAFKKQPKAKSKWWTLVARGPRLKGHRIMFMADDLGQAQKIGYQICVKKRLDCIAVFAGNMAALKYAEGQSPRERDAN